MSEPGLLKAILARHAQSLGAVGTPRAVACDWSAHYVAALLPPTVAATTLLKRCLPLGWDVMHLGLNAQSLPVSFEIRDLGDVREQDDAPARYENLVRRHLEPLLQRLGQETQLPARIFWGTAHRAFTSIFMQAADLLRHDAALLRALDSDRAELLERRTWPDGWRNPLAFRQRRFTAPAETRSMLLHATCCFAYQLPRTGYCAACPIAPQHRPSRARLDPGRNNLEVVPCSND